ncbi:hypothetical protein RHSP_38827 [Rhizobium freirei PRF 81]|uniref:Uncharacterized protein n=2 Tax=Rhizobium freirei TaxID=1353277 RepID=N6V4R8_9HYPH|nr:hypothetical protein RHSP_38827 [Rhizobium freirei PRF 81]
MVSAISSSAAATVVADASSSAATESQLQAAIKEKTKELDKATDEKTKASLQKQISKLQAQLQKLQNADKANAAANAENQGSKSGSALSGESDRIGTKNFDASTDFGAREAYV